jgi:hypothetical protein
MTPPNPAPSPILGSVHDESTNRQRWIAEYIYTNMQRVVVPTKPEEDCLFRRGLVLYDMSGCLVLGDGLGLWGTGGDFGEFLACGFGTEIERR